MNCISSCAVQDVAKWPSRVSTDEPKYAVTMPRLFPGGNSVASTQAASHADAVLFLWLAETFPIIYDLNGTLRNYHVNNNSRVTDGDEHPRTADSGQRVTDRRTDGDGWCCRRGADIDNAHWKIRKCFRNTKKKTNTKRAKRTSDRSLQILYTVCTIHTNRQSYLLSMCVWVYIDFGLSVVMPGLRCRRRRRRRCRRRWQRPVMKARFVL